MSKPALVSSDSGALVAGRDGARGHAVALARVGYLLAWSPRYQAEARSLIDCWVHRPEGGGSVLACAVTRGGT